MPYYLRHIAPLVVLLGYASAAAAQSFEAVGTRAAGMAGAFVAVADDASSAYWNPAGFAAGNFFTLVVDRTTSKSDPAALEGASKGSGLLFAMGMPALGLSYYQLRSTVLADLKAGTTDVRLETLVTHHTGATLLQSIGRVVAVGATLKLVRGVASSDVVPDGAREDILSSTGELGGRGSSKFDADIGVMSTGRVFKAGLTIRNLTQPEFRTRQDRALKLARQARAGVAFRPMEGWAIDVDVDLTRTRGLLRDVRQIAAGTEGRLGRKAFVRGGFRTNTVGGGSQAAVAWGGSYVVAGGLLVDAQITRGAARADRGWGIAARYVY